MITIANAYIIEGEFEGKPYKSGRLIALNYKDSNAKNPTFVQVIKCKDAVAQSLRGKCPVVDAKIYYDQYRNVVSIQ